MGAGSSTRGRGIDPRPPPGATGAPFNHPSELGCHKRPSYSCPSGYYSRKRDVDQAKMRGSKARGL